ncbi:GH18 domain-containing protein [Caenorhabditis elegans]|uniref:GH18 domain-containing protein n=1 Tax=Caenorhabditis elegans TaxID=6239 RepID=L8E972_CAEEL|nr:GH18 domain-containing protein [Caenorhabditis elegans]CCQ25707.1 GH18 domain-containing protein [Caenorhabditis elegans]|eukprot:NP_001263897.1 Uncharacterized protein CELE_K08F9.3 [Caenorhabditis elegans]
MTHFNPYGPDPTNSDVFDPYDSTPYVPDAYNPDTFDPYNNIGSALNYFPVRSRPEPISISTVIDNEYRRPYVSIQNCLSDLCGQIIMGCSVLLFLFVLIFGIYSLVSHSGHVQSTTPDQCDKQLIGYYNGIEGRNILENQFHNLTHAVFTSEFVNENGSFENSHKEQEFLECRKKLGESNSTAKIMIAMGFNKGSCKIDCITSFIEKYQVDGVELHWNHNEHFLSQLETTRNLKNRLKKISNSKLLGVSASSNWSRVTELDQVLEVADFVNIELHDNLRSDNLHAGV